MKAKITLRENVRLPTRKQRLMRGSQGGSSYYGFGYIQGQLVRDPREYPTLVKIHRLWSEIATVHEIVCKLNQAKIPSRKGCKWSWAAVNGIVQRFKSNEIIISGESKK